MPRIYFTSGKGLDKIKKTTQIDKNSLLEKGLVNKVLVTAEIPGVKKEDLEVSVLQNRISIKGVTSHEEESEKVLFGSSDLMASFSIVAPLIAPA